jgi:hypothetical protein
VGFIFIGDIDPRRSDVKKIEDFFRKENRARVVQFRPSLPIGMAQNMLGLIGGVCLFWLYVRSTDSPTR